MSSQVCDLSSREPDLVCAVDILVRVPCARRVRRPGKHRARRSRIVDDTDIRQRHGGRYVRTGTGKRRGELRRIAGDIAIDYGGPCVGRRVQLTVERGVRRVWRREIGRAHV